MFLLEIRISGIPLPSSTRILLQTLESVNKIISHGNYHDPLAPPGLPPYHPGMDKYYWSYEDIHETVRDLAEMVKASGFEPDVIVAIGSGGFIPARILRTYIKKPILAVGVAYYDVDDRPTETPRTL